MRGHDIFRMAAILAVAVTYVTILLGGNVMASNSGLACPDWPTCHGTFTPPLAGATGIEWVHRLSAFILSILVVGLSMLALLFERRRPVLLRLTLASLGTVLAQGLLGGLVVRSDLSVGIVLAHLALATALFALLLVVVVLANLREIPRRWLNWARQASRETEPRNAEDAQRAPRPMETPALSTSLPLRVSPGSVGPD